MAPVTVGPGKGPASSAGDAPAEARPVSLPANTVRLSNATPMTTTLPEAALETAPAPPRPNVVEGLAEVERIRELLRTNHETLQAMERRVAAMEHAKRSAEQEAARERRFLMEQQDRFLRGLLDEHEQELAEITRERDAVLAALETARARPTPGAEDEITRELAPRASESSASTPDARALGTRLDELQAEKEKLVTERDRSRDVLLRLREQRDQAFTEIASLKEQLRDAASRAAARPAVPPPARSSQPSSTAERSPNEKPPAQRPAEKRPSAGMEQSEPRPSQIPRRLTPRMPLGQLPVAALARKTPPPAPVRPLEIGNLDSDWDRRTYPAPPPSMEAGPLEGTPVEDESPDEPSRTRPISRRTPPPPELRGALTHADQTPTSPPPPLTSKSNPPAQSGASLGSDRPPLKQKPHHSERPLVDYALRAESVRPEHIEPTSSKRTPR